MGALLLLLLTQTPAAPGDVAVVVSSRREPASAQKVARSLAEVLTPHAHVLTEEAARSRIAELGGVDPVACDGQRLCLLKLAELLGPHATVIGVDVAKAGKFLSAHVEAVGAGKVESLLADDFSSDLKGFDAQSKQWARTFAEKLNDKLARWNAELEAAKPKPVATPAPAPNPGPVVVAPPPPPPPLVVHDEPPGHGPAWVATVAAGLCAIGGGVTLGLGLSNKTSYDNSVRNFLGGNQNASALTWSQLNSTANTANTEFSIALGLGIATAVAVVAAIVLFLR